MASRTVSATNKALARAQLDAAAALPGSTVTVRMSVLRQAHHRWGCLPGRAVGLTDQTVPWTDLPGLNICRECSPRIADGSNASLLLRSVLKLLGVDDDIRAAQRFAAAPGAATAAGKGVVLERRLDQAADLVRTTAAAHPRTLGDVCDQLADRLAEAAAALTQAQRGPARREPVLARVADELVSRPLRPWVTLETGRVLVGVVGHHGTGKEVQEVIDVCAVAVAGNSVLLDCPRYVLDYLNRCYAHGARSNPTFLTVDAVGLDEEVVRTAAALWAPQVAGPLMDLAAAVRAAQGVTTPS